MNTTMRQRGRNLVVFWVIVGLLSACSTQSTLNRESARKLIEQAMLKNPPTVAISLTPEVFFSFGKEESGFLAERGFDVTVLDEGKARVEFPQWARDLACREGVCVAAVPVRGTAGSRGDRDYEGIGDDRNGGVPVQVVGQPEGGETPQGD